MENDREINTPDNMEEILMYECLSKFRESLMASIIKSLPVPVASVGLDAACGIGFFSEMLASHVGERGRVTGLDLSDNCITYAVKNKKHKNLEFKTGDIRNLPFSDNSFDWLWSVDALWPGPQEFGCPAEDPTAIIQEYRRVIKPGGHVFLVYWSSQKFLPGYPVLEALLNTTSAATAPFVRGMNPSNHFMNAGNWFEKGGLKYDFTRTYSAGISDPLNRNDRKALEILINMLWGSSESEINANDWDDLKILTDPHSDRFILNNPHYYGFYTYTLFTGHK